jgi:hypothetical protein
MPITLIPLNAIRGLLAGRTVLVIKLYCGLFMHTEICERSSPHSSKDCSLTHYGCMGFLLSTPYMFETGLHWLEGFLVLSCCG